MFAPELDGKRQDILMEIVPDAHRMTAIADSTMSQSTSLHFQDVRDVARARNVELSIVAIAKPEEIVPAIDGAKASGAEALNFLATPMFFANRQLIIERVAAVGLPAMYQWPEMADDGGLAAYGSRTGQTFRQVARLVVKVLRGAKPADLPTEQPTNFELVINLKTAKTLGLTIPPVLLARADKVLE
jgi:putative tryptophan/tyrosine transport system substrate-binding protein